MAKLSGRLTAKLAEKSETYDQSLVDEINQRIKPPRPILEKDVYIRAMYIVSDNINSQGGRFGESELDILTEFIIDAPVMIGHRRDSLPVARNFKAEKISIDGRQWVKAYFYWMKDSEGAVDFKNNIDGGIYKECSISFLFSLPECSICGQDIRKCHHVPFEEYDVPEGGRAITHFWYRKIEKVLETSLVFRGAIPDTRITDELQGNEKEKVLLFTKANTDDLSIDKVGLSRARLACIKSNFTVPKGCKKLWVHPYQPGLLIRIKNRNGNIDYESPILLSEAIRDHLNSLLEQIPSKSFVIDALLYATRGKDRLNGIGLLHLLESERQLHRLKIRFCDLLEYEDELLVKEDYVSRLKSLADNFGDLNDVDIFNPREFSQNEVSNNLIKDKSAQFNYGLEILSEDESHQLRRTLKNGSHLVAGEVKSIDKKGKSHVICDVNLIHDGNKSLRLTMPTHLNIKSGFILLLSSRSGNFNNKSINYQFADVLPGVNADQIDISCPVENTKIVMYACQNDKQMMVEFIFGDKVYRALIHYYSHRLFGQKRKFIADLKITQAGHNENIRGEEILMSSVSEAGKLIHMRLADKSKTFGDCQTLWLRPVLIDGEERYLFYGGSANCQREGL